MSELKILCIDDEATTRMVLSQALSMFGYMVILAENGPEGLDKFKVESPDVVIVDRTMPVMSGDNVAAEIKAISPDVPVIMLTGDGSAMLESSGNHPHVDMILGKPLALAELNAAVVQAADL